MGPNSPYWQPYTAENKAIYSISLSRSSRVSSQRGLGLINAAASTSNVTFGFADDSSYIGQNSTTITSLSNFSYSLASLGLGPIYYTNGTATSYFFKYLSTSYPVQMNTNFVGFGAPENVYN